MLPEWIRTSDVGTGARWRIDEDEEGNHAWFGPGAEGNTDNSLVSPPMKVSEETFFGFSFRHRYDFENGGYDGAVVELTSDGGQSWIDIGQFAETGYNLELIEGPNPLTFRKAYGDTSENYPEFLTESFNLGSRFAGRIVQVRFRVGTDPFVFNTGWHIDDMEFHGIVSPPFSAFEGDVTQCVPLPKINVVTHQDLETDETGRQSVFEIDLNQPPSTDVFISLSTDLPNEGIVEPKILLFTPGNWDLPKGCLCPPIPGRSDYVHHVA
ncbi:MAG TPA: DUF890 domain-containing protein, partial [Verrucomicrobiales bacterium]|nr:DUF890 domain-containing protein [Verrucomicrobiales bacterium]